MERIPGGLHPFFSWFKSGKFAAAFLFCWIGGCLFSETRAQAGIKTISMEDYYTLLDEVALRASTWEEGWSADSLSKFLREIPDTVKVRYEDTQGKTITKEISNQWIKRSLEPNGGWSGATYRDTLQMAENLALRLEDYVEELEESSGEQVGDTLAANTVKDILASKRFEKEKEEAKKRETQRRRRGGLNPGFGNSGPWLLFGLMVVGLIFFIARMGAQADFSATAEEVEVGAGKGLLKKGEPTRASEMKKLATASKESGDLDAALRYEYLYFILLLHEKKTIRYKASYTVWEYYTLLAEKKFPHEAILQITDSFDRSVYGKKKVDSADMEKFANAVSHCLSLLNRTVA